MGSSEIDFEKILVFFSFFFFFLFLERERYIVYKYVNNLEYPKSKTQYRFDVTTEGWQPITLSSPKVVIRVMALKFKILCPHR